MPLSHSFNRGSTSPFRITAHERVCSRSHTLHSDRLVQCALDGLHEGHPNHTYDWRHTSLCLGLYALVYGVERKFVRNAREDLEGGGDTEGEAYYKPDTQIRKVLIHLNPEVGWKDHLLAVRCFSKLLHLLRRDDDPGQHY